MAIKHQSVLLCIIKQHTSETMYCQNDFPCVLGTTTEVYVSDKLKYQKSIDKVSRNMK